MQDQPRVLAIQLPLRKHIVRYHGVFAFNDPQQGKECSRSPRPNAYEHSSLTPVDKQATATSWITAEPGGQAVASISVTTPDPANRLARMRCCYRFGNNISQAIFGLHAQPVRIPEPLRREPR